MDRTLRPALLIFDVNETLSDLRPLAERFTAAGAPAELLSVWFSSVLRDGFALTRHGVLASFAELGSHHARALLRPFAADDEECDRRVDEVMSGFLELGVHDDVVPGVHALARLGVRLVTLSNGSARVAQGLLTRSGLSDAFEATLSVDDAGIWKPAAGAYEYALAHTGVEAAETMLVAVHPWDTDGAARAGLRTAWVNRGGASYPEAFEAPEFRVGSLVELATRLSELEPVPV